MQQSEVVVYGADWCSYTRRTIHHLHELDVAFRYVDTDRDPAGSQWVKDHNEGMELKPTLDIGGVVLSAPTASELERTLHATGVLPARAA